MLKKKASLTRSLRSLELTKLTEEKSKITPFFSQRTLRSLREMVFKQVTNVRASLVDNE